MNRTAKSAKPPQPPVVVLGGSGDVGRRLAGRLSGFWQGPLILAGRREGSLRSTARQIGERVEIRVIDAGMDDDAKQLPGDAVVVSLTEAATPGFVRTCLDRGAIYIDSSATQGYTAALAEVGNEQSGGGRLILYAGLMPGLSNALADAMVAGFPGIARLDIIVQLGLGRHHGTAATEWTFREAGRDYETWSAGRPLKVRPGALSRGYRYRGKGRTYRAVGFGSIDQLVAGRRNRLRDCHTFLTFDTRTASALFATALKLGFGPLMGHHARAIASALGRLPAFGTVGTHICLRGYNGNGEQLVRWELAAGDQADITAVMLAETVRASQFASTPTVADSSSLVDAKSALRALASVGLLDSETSSIEWTMEDSDGTCQCRRAF